MAEKTTWQTVSTRMNQLKNLHQRMDRTRDLAYMADFHLTTLDGKDYLSDVVNVTGNAPVVFADAIVSDLMTATWQTVVEGDISQRQAREIEQFIDDNFEQADEHLNNRFGMVSLYAWLCNHVCIRSLIGVKWLSQVDGKGNYLLDCLPCDMRWFAWGFGMNGLSYAAPIFFRNSDDIMLEYPDARLSDDKDMVLVDYWDTKRNEVWVSGGNTYDVTGGGTRIFDQRSISYPPFVIILPAAGFMLRDKGYMEHESEDIFFKNRKLYGEMNRSLSIEQTLGMETLRPAYERESEDYDAQPAVKVPEPGEVQKVPKGERAQPVPRGDMNRASLTAREDIYRQIQLGGISDAELGSAQLDRAGIWFAKQFEIRHKLEKSRFDALAMMKEGLARMMVRQFIDNAEGEIKIGRTGRKNRFSPKRLGDPDNYRISFNYGMSSKEMEIVNLAQANAARGIVPDRIIIRDILKADDPAGWERELQLQKAKETNPAISLLKMAVEYAEEAADKEDESEADMLKLQSKILTHDYVIAMRQRLQPQQPEQQQKPIEGAKANMQGLVALPGLLGGQMSGGNGRRQEVPGGR